MPKINVGEYLNQPTEDDTLSTESKGGTAESKISLLTAEEVTGMATDLLKSLGYKRTNPTKVAQEDVRHYVVEVGLKKKNATIVVDANSKKILEYEINDVVKKAPQTTTPLLKTILLICGIQILLMILFNFLSNYISIPFF